MAVRRENTKAKILLAANRQLMGSPGLTFSFSGIARELGLTKAAIFRHYGSKEKLLEAMRAQFFDELCGELRLVVASDRGGGRGVAPADFLRATIRFFARRTEYMGILKSMCSNARDIEELSRRECGKRGIRLEAPKTGGNKAAAVYVFTTVLFYVLQYREFGAASALSPDAFAESLAGFLCAGWPALREFSAEEKAFCDARCEIHPSEMTEEDRFFSALMAVALKYGILGITIERIAGELGMAKSSLYTFFESKETLIRGLIRKEVTALARLLSAKMAGVTSVSSAVYVYMHLIYRYLLLRPAIIPVIVWHFALGGAPNDLYNGLILDEPGEGLRLIAEGGGPGVGLNMPGESLALWLASLPVAAMIHLHRFFLGGVMLPHEGAEMITQIHRQMGLPLNGKVHCFIEKETA